MNITFALDGYVADSSTNLLFVFDGYLYVTPPTPPSPSGGGGGGSSSRRIEKEQEEERSIKHLKDEDDIIFSIIKAFLICQN